MLINIQFLRFAAAMLVVIFHESAHLRATGHAQGPLYAFGDLAGFAGVDLFFVISGFIMAWTTRGQHGPADAWCFARRRIARIYSGYWPFCLLALLLFGLTDPQRLARVDLPGSLVLWPIAMPKMLIPVAWTLVFEMIFYTAFTLAIAISGRQRPRLLVALLVVAVLAAVYYQFARDAWSSEQIVHLTLVEVYAASPFLVEFLAGAVLAGRLRQPAGTRLTGMLWLLAGVTLFVAGAWVNALGFEGRIDQGYFVFWRVAVFGTAGLLMVTGLVRLEQFGITAPGRFSLAAGGASYALYLSHTMVFEACRVAGLNDWLAGKPGWLAHAVFIALALLILSACMRYYQHIERRLHRSFRKALRA